MSADDARLPVSPADHFWRRIFPAYWIFLFCVTHFPGLNLAGPRGSDKVVHMVAFGLLALLLWRFMKSCYGTLGPWFVWKALVVVLAYAAFDEVTQPLMRRGAELGDWCADSIGGAATLGLLEAIRRYRLRRLQNDA